VGGLLDASKPAGGFDMDWKMHMIAPLFVYIFAMLVFQMPVLYAVQALTLILFASFLPDLDHPKALVRKATFIIIFYLMVFAVTAEMAAELWLKFVVITIMLVLTRYAYKHLPVKHRGKKSLHLWRYAFVLPTVFAFVFVVANINITLVLFTIAGYGTHLALDKINKF
jgi:hypothetical protein